MPTSKDFTHMRMLFTLFRNVFNFNWLQQCKLRAGVKGAHVHQPMAWPVPHTCAQLFRPYWGSSVQCTCSRRVNERGRQMQSTSLICSFVLFSLLPYNTLLLLHWFKISFCAWNNHAWLYYAEALQPHVFARLLVGNKSTSMYRSRLREKNVRKTDNNI